MEATWRGQAEKTAGGFEMDLERIKRIVALASGTDIEEIEYRDKATQIKLRFEVEGHHRSGHEQRDSHASSPAPPEGREGAAPAVMPAAQSPAEGGVKAQEPLKTVIIKSPTVGRCYLNPPGKDEAEPYVLPGGEVKIGQIISIIEAMGIRNEVRSDHDGKVLSLLVENGQAVEYGQPLLALEAASQLL
jgi:acetyl-CoA carboxylase biotin carboxyl carrier protein